MPLDAVTLRHLTAELDTRLAGARVDKVHMPDKNEVLLLLRAKEGNVRLLLSANPNTARLQLTEARRENPRTPPMLCMLLRKHLTGARITAVFQEPMERVVRVLFETVSELGDLEPRELVLELMGRGSNLLLLGPEQTVLAALRYIDISEGKSRQLIPGIRYALPDKPDKLDPLQEAEALSALLDGAQETVPFDKFLLNHILGLSPLLSREIAHRVCGDGPRETAALSAEQRQRAAELIASLLSTEDTAPTLVLDGEGTPVDFTCLPLTQYGGLYTMRPMPDYCSLLDAFYALRDEAQRKKQRGQQLSQLLKNLTERTARKLSHQKAELEGFRDRDKYRVYGELLSASLHLVPKGAAFVELPNYYEEDTPLIRIPLDVTKSPVQNAQSYFKKYQKAKNGELILGQQMEKGERELQYLRSVQHALEQADTAAELTAIREELQDGGYIQLPRGEKRRKTQAPEKPMAFLSDDGFVMLVGKNNAQNDQLVQKTGRKEDWWLHVLGEAGSHVLVQSEGRTVPDSTLEQAAMLAAHFSKAEPKEKVPVTYTELRNVKKPAGSKPGYVVYFSSQTAYVTVPEGYPETLKRP
ncbi:MAG: NFACT family protein [Clostridia bacterium]|nr:NFACT family protein [Clostridia bacterium]